MSATSLPGPTRRTVIAGIAAVIGAGPALAQAPTRFGSLAVDVGPLRRQGLGPYADRVAAILRAELASAFSDRLGGRGPRLVVRIDGVSLRSYAGSDSWRFGGSGTQSDYLEGEALVVGPKGQVLLRHPQLSALPASSGGAWYLPDNEDRRLAAIARHFAAWLRRDLG